jgi:integrase
VASAWIERRATGDGVRYRVRYRLGGREAPRLYAGVFRTMREARARRDWVAGELAALRVPDLRTATEPAAGLSFRSAADAWLDSRVDIAAGTRRQLQTSVGRAVGYFGSKPIRDVMPQHVAAMVTTLHESGLKPGYLRKILQATAMVFDHHDITPNPARARRVVRLPYERRAEIVPPTAEHVLAVHALLPARSRLPLLVIDATGMRVGEVEALAWGDVDESRSRWRVSRAVAKTARGRWVTVPPVLFAAVLALCPREDRAAERRVFDEFGADRFRTAITRACTAAGVPVFSPHDLRHRRISLLHLAGVPWVTIGQAVGQRDIATTANTYSHVMADEVELDYPSLIRPA